MTGSTLAVHFTSFHASLLFIQHHIKLCSFPQELHRRPAQLWHGGGASQGGGTQGALGAVQGGRGGAGWVGAGRRAGSAGFPKKLLLSVWG